MKKIFKKLKKHWIAIWLFTAAFLACSFAVFAAYTGIYSVKRIVSTTASSGVRFSSNSMQSYSEGSIPTRHITTSQSSGDYVYNLTVCDFAQSDPSARYASENGIYYDLTAQLCVKINGNYYPVNDSEHVPPEVQNHANSRSGFTIRYASDGGDPVTNTTPIPLGSGNVVTFNGHNIRPQQTGMTIPNGINKYEIVFDGFELEDNQDIDYYIKLTAHPQNGDSSLDNLACYLYLSKMVVTDSAWSGRLQETGDTSVYDAYNYILEGSGTGNVTVRWNSDFIDVSQVFINQNNLSIVEETIENVTWKKFVLHVDDTKGRYEIQLYKNNPGGNYRDVSGYISSSYSAE